MMNKSDAENLFASLFRRWTTGDVDQFERDYREDVEVDFDGDLLGLQDLKERTLFFARHFEFLSSRIEDFIFDANQLAVRIYFKLKEKKTGKLIEDQFFWFFELKSNQVIRFWSFLNHSLGFSEPETL